MRVGVNSRIYQYAETGIPYFIKNLYSTALADKKWNKEEIFFFQTELKKKIGITSVIPKKNSISDILFDLYYVDELIKKQNIDIFHGPSNILPLKKNKKTKYVLTIHDLSFIVKPELCGVIFRNYYKYIVGESLKRADLVVCDSESTKKDLQNFYNSRNYDLIVIPLAINKLFKKNTVNKKNRINAKYFLSICTHPKRKNIYNVLRAFAMSNLINNYKFVLVGLFEPKFLIEIKSLLNELNLKDNVILTGYVSEEDLINYYQHASFFIYPSFYEGFGLPILESMHFNIPVITSNISSMTEFKIDEDLLVNPNNVRDIKQKMNYITSLSQNELKIIKQKNYKFSKKFSWDKTSSLYLEAFKKLI